MALTLISSHAAGREFEQEVTRLLAGGRFGAARRCLAGQPPSPFTELVGLDLRSRRLDAGLADLQALRDRLAGDAGAWARFGLWAETLIAERMVLDGDHASATWARRLLDAVTAEPYPPVPVLYARARLRRLAALGSLGEPAPANRAAFRRFRDGAVDDFLRCGFRVEAAATAAVAAGMHLVRTHEEPHQTLDRIAEARAVLADAPASEWGPVLDVTWAMASIHVGDVAAALPVLAGADHDGAHPLARATARFGVALAGVGIAAGDRSALAALDSAIDDTRRASPRHAVTEQSIVAHVLADFGRPEMARYARPALDAPRRGEPDEVEARVLRLRADLVAGAAPPAADVQALLGRLVDLRLRRLAGVHALRFARDYERLGQPADGDAFAGGAWRGSPRRRSARSPSRP